MIFKTTYSSSLECAGQLHVDEVSMQSVYTIFSSSFKCSSDLFSSSKQTDQKTCPLTVHGNLALVARTGEVGNFPDIGIHCKKNENAVRDTVDNTFLLPFILNCPVLAEDL